MLQKFEKNDVFRNFLKTYPHNSFFIYQNMRFWNNNPAISGNLTGNVGHVPPGYVNLYELNIDRLSTSDTYNSDTNSGVQSLIRPFTIKSNNANIATFKTIPTSSFFSKSYSLDSNGNVIPIQFTGSYPISASISVHYYSNNSYRTSSYIESLKNITNFYSKISPHYQYSSSILSRDFNVSELTVLNIPKIFYGDKIHKGSVSLKFLISGTLISELQDIRKNGELVQVGPFGSLTSGTVNGVCLYNEGVIILTGSSQLTGTHQENYVGGGNTSPKWVYFGSSISGTTPQSTPSSSYVLDFKGVNVIPTLTMFTHAKSGQMNNSNNLSWIRTGSILEPITSSNSYTEDRLRVATNLVSSSFSETTGSFQKITYISTINIYDKEKNIIAIAKLAKPVKKLEERDITFKLKVDL